MWLVHSDDAPVQALPRSGMVDARPWLAAGLGENRTWVRRGLAAALSLAPLGALVTALWTLVGDPMASPLVWLLPAMGLCLLAAGLALTGRLAVATLPWAVLAGAWPLGGFGRSADDGLLVALTLAAGVLTLAAMARARRHECRLARGEAAARIYPGSVFGLGGGIAPSCSAVALAVALTGTLLGAEPGRLAEIEVRYGEAAVAEWLEAHTQRLHYPSRLTAERMADALERRERIRAVQALGWSSWAADHEGRQRMRETVRDWQRAGADAELAHARP